MKKTLVVLACALAASAAFAQASAPVAAPAQASAASMPAADRDTARVEARITQLHSQLKITAAQEAQWKTFADVMRENGATMDKLYHDRIEAAKTQSALDNMKQYADIAQAHADGMKKLVGAFEPLYSSLSPQQKQLADTTFRARMSAPGGHRRGHTGKASAAEKPAEQ
ncbi:Spy/CpxP family protein refolding chaperone [Trinickia fusca]|uniref:LTXXQ motif family protein n=1 Tax=Trinickia fusca TaxID=2419777 RepID=A0A494XPE6_9BURK|nr:Spy/CpxP family protein refolding chaperone [Trinickia fusca]RKP52520.1 hypothetical protein D7S89_03155 [Trinickia fusca]